LNFHFHNSGTSKPAEKDKNEEILSSPIVWDGAESKRKSLLSSSISLKSIPIDDNSQIISEKSSNLRSHSFEVPFEMPFRNWFPKQSPKNASMSRKNIKTSCSSSDKSVEANSATPVRARADSNSSISSSSETSRTSYPSSEFFVDGFYGQKKKMQNNLSLGNGLQLSSLLQMIPDGTILTHECETDPDQDDILKRINKCLFLKDILRSIITTIQQTQDSETSSLRKMRRLKSELITLIDKDSITSITTLNRNSGRFILTRGTSTESSDEQDSTKNRVSSSAYSAKSSGVCNSSRNDLKRWSGENSGFSDECRSPLATKFSARVDRNRSISGPQDGVLNTSESHDSLSLGSTASPMIESGFHEAAAEFVDDLKVNLFQFFSRTKKFY
jgi:hypothetical protein